MSHLLYRIGNFAGRHPWRVVAAWVVAAIAVVTLNAAVGGQSDDGFRLPGSESQRAADIIEQRFPQQTLYSSHVIFHAPGGLTDRQTRAVVDEAVSELRTLPHVIAVSGPYDPRGPTLSRDGRTAFATVGFDVEKVGPDEYDAADRAVRAARDAGVEVEYDGALAYANSQTGGNGELIGILVAIVVLVIAFGSLVAMSLPIGAALTAIGVGTSLIGILSGVTSMPKIAGIVAVMLGLGAGIDYALFILARHRQNLAAGQSVPVVIGRANATAGLSVLFAGLTVIIAILGLNVAGVPMLSMMGYASAVMVAVTMLAAITLLPAMLGIVKHRVNSLRVPLVRTRAAYSPDLRSARWTRRVVARPARYGAVATVVLGILAIPAFSMHLGFADAGNDPQSMTSRRAYDQIASAYGPGTNGTLQVVLQTQDGEPLTPGEIRRVDVALGAQDGVAAVGRPAVNEQGDIAVLSVTPTTSPQDDRTGRLVQQVRSDTLPAAVSGTDVRASVTGETALAADLSDRLQTRMVWFLAAVIGLSFLVLTVLFRSILVPVKAALLNILGVGAAYGVIVAVFQWGWGASLIGVHETVPIMPLAPMLMFAILFGLSMDYEVFLMSRVREQYVAHGDPGRAVVEGVGSTARVITSAGLIMISVFAAFITDHDVTTKLFGVGLSVAVLLDVTLVRLVLVPAAMSLLGHRAWWLPAWLERRLPVIDMEGGSHDGAEPDLPVEQPAPADRPAVLV
jgi:RND superfamily putative drug exporter